MWTKDYKHDYYFIFKGEKYNVYSIVRLTEDGRKYLGALKREAILTEVFINRQGKRCWKYEFMSNKLNVGIINMSTDVPPGKLIEKVIQPATNDYFLREEFGITAPNYKNGEKQTKKDLEIPEVKRAWIIYIAVFLGVAIFKDWYVKFIIRVAVSWVFGMYRQTYVNAYTVYIHNDDAEMLKKKHETLYGIKNNEEDDDK
jgi:hypothetical protein